MNNMKYTRRKNAIMNAICIIQVLTFGLLKTHKIKSTNCFISIEIDKFFANVRIVNKTMLNFLNAV